MKKNDIFKRVFTRRLALPPPGTRTFFLWGPRQVGKTTLLRQCYPDAFWVDLLKADEFRRYATRPESLRLALQALGPDLLGRWLPAYRKRPKRRVAATPRFYFFDVGVVNRLARRGELHPGSELFGKAFENWLFHELGAHLAYTRSPERLAYWRLAGGAEVDFIIGDMRAAVEAKAVARIGNRHLKGLRALGKDHPEVGRRIVVCIEPRPLRTDDGIDILPVADFLDQLWSGALLG